MSADHAAKIVIGPNWRAARLEAWQACDFICLVLDFDRPGGSRLISLLQACGLEVWIGPGLPEATDVTLEGAESREFVVICSPPHIADPQIRTRLAFWKRLLPFPRILLLEEPETSPAPLPQIAPGHIEASPVLRGAKHLAAAGGAGQEIEQVQALHSLNGIEAILAEAGFLFQSIDTLEDAAL